jgi:hypothetical protein
MFKNATSGAAIGLPVTRLYGRLKMQPANDGVSL